MSNPQKRKGDKAELEIQAILRDQLGVGRRALGAGRKDDVGDIHGVPELTVQVAAWANVAAAVREKPRQCADQQDNAGTQFGVTAVRLRGGDWRWVMTTDQFLAIYREATA